MGAGDERRTTATRERRSWIWAWSPARCRSTPARLRCWRRRAQGLSATGTLAASGTYTAAQIPLNLPPNVPLLHSLPAGCSRLIDLEAAIT